MCQPLSILLQYIEPSFDGLCKKNQLQQLTAQPVVLQISSLFWLKWKKNTLGKKKFECVQNVCQKSVFTKISVWKFI